MKKLVILLIALFAMCVSVFSQSVDSTYLSVADDVREIVAKFLETDGSYPAQISDEVMGDYIVEAVIRKASAGGLSYKIYIYREKTAAEKEAAKYIPNGFKPLLLYSLRVTALSDGRFGLDSYADATTDEAKEIKKTGSRKVGFSLTVTPDGRAVSLDGCKACPANGVRHMELILKKLNQIALEVLPPAPVEEEFDINKVEIIIIDEPEEEEE